MKVVKAFKFRLKTNKEARDLFSQFAGSARFLWNKVLAHNLKRLERKENIFFYHESCFWLTLWKKSEEYGFLKECPSQVLQQKLKDLDKAFRDCFDKKQPLKRMPKFKKKGQSDSFRYPQGFKLEGNRLFLPKLGWVSYFNSQAIVGTPKNITVSRQGKHWYASIQTEYEIDQPVHRSKTSIGIDLGVASFASLSDGSQIEPVHAFKYYQKKLASAQRKLSKKVKFSQNWKKQKLKITNLHHKIKNIRHDALHKLSTNVCKNHATIFVEDLKILNMTRSAKGTIESPGRNVKAKSGLNRSILDQGWGEFKRQLSYKSTWLGGSYFEVSPRHTSQICSHCGYKDAKNRISQAEFICLSCGHEENADLNAAKNILAVGHTVSACREGASVLSVKQEPSVVTPQPSL